MTLSNYLTLLRGTASLIFIPIVAIDDQLARLFALLIFTLAAFSDYYDGRLARLRNEKTTFGVIADPIADKFLTVICFVSLSLLRPEMVPFWMTVLIIVRELLITSWRFYALSRGRVLAPNRWGKWKTGLQMTAIPYALLVTALFSGDAGRELEDAIRPLGFDTVLFGIGWMLSFIAVFITIFSGFNYIAAELKNRR